MQDHSGFTPPSAGTSPDNVLTSSGPTCADEYQTPPKSQRTSAAPAVCVSGVPIVDIASSAVSTHSSAPLVSIQSSIPVMSVQSSHVVFNDPTISSSSSSSAGSAAELAHARLREAMIAQLRAENEVRHYAEVAARATQEQAAIESEQRAEAVRLQHANAALQNQADAMQSARNDLDRRAHQLRSEQAEIEDRLRKEHAAIEQRRLELNHSIDCMQRQWWEAAPRASCSRSPGSLRNPCSISNG